MERKTLTKEEEKRLLDSVPTAYQRAYWAIWRAAKTGQPAPDSKTLQEAHGNCTKRMLGDHLLKMERLGLIQGEASGMTTGWYVPALGKSCITLGGNRTKGKLSRKALVEKALELNAWAAGLGRDATLEEAGKHLTGMGPIWTDTGPWTPAQTLYLAIHCPWQHPDDLGAALGKSHRQVQARINLHGFQRFMGYQPKPKSPPWGGRKDFKTQRVNPLEGVVVTEEDVRGGALVNHYILRRMGLTGITGCRLIRGNKGDPDWPRYCGKPTAGGAPWCDSCRPALFTGATANGKNSQGSEDQGRGERSRPGRKRSARRYDL